MFLSSRWGKPSYEIESLPLSEFNKQKLFWEHHSWGGIDDIMAMNYALALGKAGGKKTQVTEIKRIATLIGAARTVVVESTKAIRKAFMGIATAMKKANK